MDMAVTCKDPDSLLGSTSDADDRQWDDGLNRERCSHVS